VNAWAEAVKNRVSARVEVFMVFVLVVLLVLLL
jgi:hypothetical protein